MSDLDRFRSSDKLRAHGEWVDAYVRGEDVYPVALEIDPSNRCPLTCPECVWGQYISAEHSELPADVLRRIVDEAAGIGVKSITWTGGGEPLINPGTVPAIQRSRELGMKNGMFTSAVPMAPHVADALHDNLSWIRFHLDGADPVSYARHHRVSEQIFHKVLRNLTHFSENRGRTGSGPAAGIGTIAYRSNIGQAPELARLAKTLGLDYFQYKHDLLLLLDDDYLDWWNAEALPMMNGLADELEDERFGLQFPRGTDFGKLDLSPTCHVHHLHTAITADGRVSYCKRTRDQTDWSLGSIHENSLREIFDSEKHREIRQRITPTTCGVLPCPLKQANLALQSMVDSGTVADLSSDASPALIDEDFL